MKSVLYALLAIIMMSAAGFGQGLGPVVNGVDFSGSWFPGRHQEAGLGTAAGSLVDYGGIPINEASRIYALSWPASRQIVRQHQCQCRRYWILR